MRTQTERLFSARLVKASAWLFAGGLLGGVLGYIFQVLVGRMLTAQEYSLFSSIMALFTVLAAPQNALMLVISRKISQYRVQADHGSTTHFYYWIFRRVGLSGLFLILATVLLASRVGSYLNSPTKAVVYLLGILIFASCLPVINNAFLLGFQNFSWISISTSLGVCCKIIFSALLIWFGYGVSGAVFGTILATVISGLISFKALQAPLRIGQRAPYKSAHLSLRPAMPVLTANIAFAAMTQLDIVIVNYFFLPEEAGLYAAASVLGKAVLYISSGISLSLFPMAAESHVGGDRSLNLLIQAMLLTTLLSGAGAFFYLLAGEQIVIFLYGNNYQGAGEILKLYGFAIFPMSLVMVAEHFLIAQGRVLFAYLFLLIAPIQFLLISLNHSSVQSILVIMGLSGLTLMFLGYGFLFREYTMMRINSTKVGI